MLFEKFMMQLHFPSRFAIRVEHVGCVLLSNGEDFYADQTQNVITIYVLAFSVFFAAMI